MTKIIHDFSVYSWLAALMAVSFSGAAFGVAGIVGALGAFVLVGGLGFFSLSFAYGRREEKEALKKMSDGVAVFGIIAFLLVMFSSGILMGLVILLLFLHLALNLIFREHRQIGFGLLINFITLMTGAVNTFSAGYLFFILGFCVCVCFYTALLFVDKQRYLLSVDTAHIHSADNPHSHNQLQPQSQGQSQRQAHHQNSRNQGASDNRQNTELSYVGQWRARDKLVMASFISVLAGVIYLLTPHFPAGNLGGIQIKGFGKYTNDSLESQILPEGTDLNEHFRKEPNNKGENDSNRGTGTTGADGNSADSGSEGQSPMPMGSQNEILYYVKSDKPRYLQTDTYTHFDGASWQRLQYGWKRLAQTPQRLDDFTVYPTQPNASVGVTVAQDSASNQLLTTHNTVAIRFPSLWVATDYYDQLKVAQPLKEDTSYELMVLDSIDDATGRSVDENQADPDSKDLQLPRNLDKRIKKLTEKITLKSTSKQETAEILEDYIRTQHTYTLDTINNQNNVPLGDFLFESKRGHCEYFATAMAVMLRQKGIPARMIGGYVTRDKNPITGFYEVTDIGHVWVQAYINGKWMLYEPTAAYEVPKQDAESSIPNTYENVSDYLEEAKKQNERLESVKEMTILEKITNAVTTFLYMSLMVFTLIVTWTKKLLPFVLLATVICGGMAWYGLRWWRSTAVARADKKGHKELLKLVPHEADQQDIKNYLHECMRIYQQMLARHGVMRPRGQQIETFARSLLSKNLCDSEQSQVLIDVHNAYFYATSTSDVSIEYMHQLFIALYEQGLERVYTD